MKKTHESNRAKEIKIARDFFTKPLNINSELDMEIYKTWPTHFKLKDIPFIAIKENNRLTIKKEMVFKGDAEYPTSIKLLVYKGESMRVPEWAKKLGVSTNLLYGRIRGGCSDEETIERTLNFRKSKKYAKFENLSRQEY